MNTKIEIYKDINIELKEIWINFEKNSLNHCFQSFSWILYVINFSKKNQINFILQIVVIKKNNQTVAIFPFWITNYFGLKVLRWIGNDFSDYNAPVISKDFNYIKDDFFNDFYYIKKNLQTFDLINFERQNSNILGKNNPFYYYLKNTDILKTYFILASNKFSYKKINKKELIFFHSDEILEYNKYINTILDLKKLQFNQNIFFKKNDNFLRFFYNKLSNIESNHLKIYLSILKTQDGHELSYNFGILYKNYFYYLIPAYTDNLKKISPGKLLLYKILNWCFDNNVNILDFGQGDEEYKSKLTDKYNFIGNYNYINTYKGYLFFIIIILKKIKLLKKIFK